MPAERQQRNASTRPTPVAQKLQPIHDSSSGDWLCPAPTCSKSFGSRAAANRHAKTHLADGEKEHQCTFCSKRFVQKNQLNTHVASQHTGAKPYPCKVPGCDREFSDPSLRTRHVKRAHPGETSSRGSTSTPTPEREVTASGAQIASPQDLLPAELTLQAFNVESSADMTNMHLWNDNGAVTLDNANFTGLYTPFDFTKQIGDASMDPFLEATVSTDQAFHPLPEFDLSFIPAAAYGCPQDMSIPAPQQFLQPVIYNFNDPASYNVLPDAHRIYPTTQTPGSPSLQGPAHHSYLAFSAQQPYQFPELDPFLLSNSSISQSQLSSSPLPPTEQTYLDPDLIFQTANSPFPESAALDWSSPSPAPLDSHFLFFPSSSPTLNSRFSQLRV